jgi:lipopolysaccharide transport system ATP-binding protein
VIVLEGVRLDRRTREEYANDLKARLFALATGRYRRPRRKVVLDDIDIVIARGEKVGIIGPNGAGKSTLLKLICGVLEPSAGRVAVDGRVAPLLELGAGFDPDMTVVDNIMLYGVLLGLDRRIVAERSAEILRFAELEEYAHYPVHALSSGMAARLGFSIATDVDPDILLIDEALAVGDESFRAKSKLRIDALWRHDTTVVVVSHDLAYIRSTCERAIWLDRGRICAAGTPAEVVAQYVRAVDDAAVVALLRARAGAEVKPALQRTEAKSRKFNSRGSVFTACPPSSVCRTMRSPSSPFNGTCTVVREAIRSVMSSLPAASRTLSANSFELTPGPGSTSKLSTSPWLGCSVISASLLTQRKVKPPSRSSA